MDDVLQRFLEQAPVTVMVRAALAHAFAGPALDALFDRAAQRQYTKELTFSTLVQLFAKVTFGTYDSVHAAYRHAAAVPVSVTCVYDKLGHLEPGVCAALVRETAVSLAAVRAALPAAPAEAVAGLRLRTLDGNFLAGTDRRLGCLRGSGAAALPGMALVVRDGATGLLTDLVPCEDAYTNERSLAAAVLALARPDDLWLGDRNFCTGDYLGGLAQRGACFLIRHHRGTHLEAAGPERFVGTSASGDLYEQEVRVGPLRCRCIRVRLHQPLRDGATELRLLSNVPGQQVGARRLAELYRTRWQIETAFQELTVALRCEVNTLGYPKAALFAFALAVAAYNVLALLKAALAGGAGRAEAELSGYHLASEVAAVAEGLAIAVPAAAWERFARMAAAEFAAWLAAVAAGLDWGRYRKSPRGPKKPRAVQRTRRGAHRSTARLLQAKRHGKTP
jgi:Transposase DDE domain